MEGGPRIALEAAVATPCAAAASSNPCALLSLQATALDRPDRYLCAVTITSRQREPSWEIVG